MKLSRKTAFKQLSKAVDKIERWSGSAYCGYASDLGNDELAQGIEEVKMVAIALLHGTHEEYCAHCQGETTMLEPHGVCECGEKVTACGLCDGSHNEECFDDCPQKYDRFRISKITEE